MRARKALRTKGRAARAITLALCATLFFGCAADRAKPVVIWTDRAELVRYVELFNARQQTERAIVVYKSPLANALPPAKDEDAPDIIIGSWLKDSRLRRHFLPLENLFDGNRLNPDTIYPHLLAYGAAGAHQYLLPVSFNVPLVMFSAKHAERIPDAYMLTPEAIREVAAAFNVQNSRGIYTNMGFAPSWNPDFLYVLAKMDGLSFREKKGAYHWDDALLSRTIDFLKAWTTEKNTSTAAEQDFAFKYLYTPGYRQVESGRCLFAYTSSDALFSIPDDQLDDIDFRWIAKDSFVPVKDDIVMMGIFRHSDNTQAAQAFVLWLMQEETLRAIMERTERTPLNVSTFGIAGGFSAVRSVNERVFPSYYRNLLGNLPDQDAIKPPPSFPLRWYSFKEHVVIPYLRDATNTTLTKTPSLKERITVWSMQFN